VDLVIYKDGNSLIEKEALKGIKLWKLKLKTLKN
jgi:hypothetical protein